MLKRIKHHIKKRKENIFRAESPVDWEFVISIALAVVFGLVALNFFLKPAWSAGIGTLVIAVFLLIPEESISRWIKMNFTWKHKAVIIIILAVIAGYFYFQGVDEVSTVEVQPPEDTEDLGEVPAVEEGAEPAATTITETDGEASPEAIEEQPTPIGQVFEIEMTDHLEPADLTVPVGSTVVWKNLEKRPHLIHIYTLNGGYETITVGEKIGLVGDSWEYTFEEVGVYNYRDTVFNWRGIITVE